MRVESVSCKNFRNLLDIQIKDFEEMNVICGENAQGKTNLLEAIWLFTGAKSFRSSKDQSFICFGKDKAQIDLEFNAEGIKNDARITVNETRTAEINGNKLKSASLLAGKFNAVVFSPDDLSLIKAGPAVRRRFIDTAIGQLYPSYIGILRNYSRAVTQRNRIIKDYRYDSSLSVMLDVFEKEIAASGRKIISFRKNFTEKNKNFLPYVYAGISCGKEKLEMNYVTSSDENELEDVLLESRKTDMYTGSTGAGPHRDEIEFKINGISARNFGSQGQMRSVALSLKLAEAEVINNISGEYPVFLLDDVMSELDPERQNYVLNHIKGLQAFITCCDPSNIGNLKKGKILNMKNGRIC